MTIYSFLETVNGYKIYECGEAFAVVDPTNPVEHEAVIFDGIDEAVEYCEEND